MNADLRSSSSNAPYRAGPPELRDWLVSSAVPLSIQLDGSLDDFEPLRPALERARVVGLGEANHGSSEFFRLKHRFVRFLVERMGFTAFAIEGWPAECTVVDDYVRHGRGDAADAATMIYGGGFPWDVIELVELIDWLRAWNDSHERTIGFYGFDAHAYGCPILLARFLKRAGLPGIHALDPITSPSALRDYQTASRQERAAVRADIDRLVATLDEGRVELEARFGPLEWDRARRMAQGCQQLATCPTPAAGEVRRAPRERAQAETIESILGMEGRGGKVVAWAHNAHIGRLQMYDGAPAMGAHLTDLIGPSYVAVGFASSHGRFRAGALDGSGLREFELEPAHRGSLDGALATAEDDCFAIDLRDAPPRVSAWLHSPVPGRMIGGAFSDTPSKEMLTIVPAEAYDLMAFVRCTSAAVALRRLERYTIPPPLPAPQNLELSDRGADGVPIGWFPILGRSPIDYTLESGDSIRLRRRPGPWTGGSASLRQLVDASRFRGQAVRVSASTLRVPPAEVEVFSEVFAHRPESPPLAATSANVDAAGVGAVTLRVPDEADILAYGVRISGAGGADIRSFAVA